MVQRRRWAGSRGGPQANFLFGRLRAGLMSDIPAGLRHVLFRFVRGFERVSWRFASRTGSFPDLWEKI